MRAACTFRRVRELADECKAQGLEGAEFQLVGWNLRGHDGRWPQAFPVEEALGYQTLIGEFGLTQEDASKQVGKSRSAVANALRLLGLCPEVVEKLRNEEITAGHARAILAAPTPELQIQAAQQTATQNLSVRQTEALVKALSRQPKEKPKNDQPDIALYLGELEKDLSGQMGRKVKITQNDKKRSIELFYDDDDDIDESDSEDELTTDDLEEEDEE